MGFCVAIFGKSSINFIVKKDVTHLDGNVFFNIDLHNYNCLQSFFHRLNYYLCELICIRNAMLWKSGTKGF